MRPRSAKLSRRTHLFRNLKFRTFNETVGADVSVYVFCVLKACRRTCRGSICFRVRSMNFYRNPGGNSRPSFPLPTIPRRQERKQWRFFRSNESNIGQIWRHLRRSQLRVAWIISFRFATINYRFVDFDHSFVYLNNVEMKVFPSIASEEWF